MDNGDRVAIQSMFDATIKPVKESVARIETSQTAFAIDQVKHGKDIAVMKKQLENTGDCAEHKAKVTAVELDIKENIKPQIRSLFGRMWALILGIPALLVGAIATVVHFSRK